VAGGYFDVVFDVPLDRSFSYLCDEKGQAEVGKRVMAPFGRREVLGYVVAAREEPPEGVKLESIKSIRRVVDAEPIFAVEEIELARWMAGYYLCGIGEALAAMIPSGRREVAPPAFADEELEAAAASLDLSQEQERALEAIMESHPAAGELPIASPPMYYLYGITGSGKTEVFLRAAERTLAAGKSVIYLVPEIALTHQVIEAVSSRFGTAAATLHSGMTPSSRLAEWTRIRRGEARVIVGPRSAVFAPAKELGLIVIDEEHDGSYKSGNSPRYHARQVALKRCAAAGARLVMGSATPSAETWKLMADGAIRRLDLTSRLSGGAPPAIQAVSLEGTDGCLTRELKEEIRATAQAGRQTILFLNRRGFSYFYRCKQCGFALTCKHCSVSLTYHKSRGRAICHYCGYSLPPPSACPECGSLEAGFAGFGTEMIEEEVQRTFPELRVRRADADATAKKGSLKETLDVFRAGGIDVLLGTQMVAKGLNFPGVRLVGVVLADTGLQLPDFRAAERTFALIVQVAGRAGRYFPDGRVIVQTFRPHESAIAHACALDVEGFYRAELAQRKALGFPPYTRLIRFVARSKDAIRAAAAIRRLAVSAAKYLPAEADILGPAECPIGVIAGNARMQLILRCPSMGPLHAAARRALADYEAEKEPNTYLEADVDPVSLL
jgi:primosomal protein N' (replication factor Y)